MAAEQSSLIKQSKLVFLTGGNSGIGLEACKILSAKGYTVVASVRTDTKGEDMKAQVKTAVPEADIHYVKGEMSDPKSIRAMVEDFKSQWLIDGRMLDVLINNAGAAFNYPERTLAEVNPEWEKTVVVNAMAPIMVTDLLLDCLKETTDKKGEARIVMVNSSVTTDFERMNPYQTNMDDVMLALPGAYNNANTAYKISKVLLMMATLKLVEELSDTNIYVNSMCPGLIPGTNIALSNTHESRIRRTKCILCCFGCLLGKSNKQGGQYIVDVADGERGKTKGIFYVRGKVREAPPQVQNKESQSKSLQILRDMAASQ